MGYYINPKNMTKEEWLDQHGLEVNLFTILQDGAGLDKLPVCLVDNRIFTAAGICYDERELKEFSDPADIRPKKWWTVPIKDLLEIEPRLEQVLSRSEDV